MMSDCRKDGAAIVLHSRRGACASAFSLEHREIPFGAGSLTGYLIRPAGPIVPRPTLILPAGYNSAAESGYVETAWMALTRGMNAFTLEGPGQGGTLYRDRIPMRPDFEAVLTPAVDWLFGQEGVDRAKVALISRSFAGYLAPRGAAHEYRFAALVCDPGQFEFVSRIKKMVLSKVASDDATRPGTRSPPPMHRLIKCFSSPKRPAHARDAGAAHADPGCQDSLGEFIRKQAAVARWRARLV